MTTLFRDLHGAPPGPRGSVACIGAFDGLHLGHRALVRQTMVRARELDVDATVVSFDPLPREFFAKGDRPPRLMLPRAKFEGLHALGVDQIGLLRFNAALAAMPAESFVRELLVERLGVREVWVGPGFRFGQGRQANATIGRALGLMLLNVAGAKPGEMDRSTQGNPAKFTFCFGENEEENPWTPYHVQRGFAPTDSVVTVMSGEGPHNLNDHGSTSGDGLLTTFAGGMATPGANTIYGKGPMFVIIGPEHAATLKRDGFTIETIRQELFARSRVHVSRISAENQDTYISTGHKPDGDWFSIARAPEDIHITVAGGPGKHSAFIPSFGGTTVACTRIAR